MDDVLTNTPPLLEQRGKANQTVHFINLKKMYTNAQTAAINAIKGYQERSLIEYDMNEVLRHLVDDVSTNVFDYGDSMNKMVGFCMKTIVLMTRPEFRALYNEYQGEDLPGMLQGMYEFFQELKGNKGIEASMELSYVTEYQPDDAYCEQLTEWWSSMTDGCKSEYLRIVKPAKVQVLQEA